MVNGNNPQSHGQQVIEEDDHAHDWQVVLRQSNGKVVLYHSNSNQLSVYHQQQLPPIQNLANNHHPPLKLLTRAPASSSDLVANRITRCPLCLQALDLLPLHPTPASNSNPIDPTSSSNSSIPPSSSFFNQNLDRATLPQPPTNPRTVTRPAYFDLLSQSNTPLPSQSITPIEVCSPRRSESSTSSLDSVEWPQNLSDRDPSEPLGQEKRVDGYYERFFIEVMKLGRGQKGSVFLCTHTLDGNPLGHYAVKKIAIGQSSPELLHVLSEVRFLESLRHRNIAQYHHAWIEKAQLSRFGPKVPVLYILMDFANGGTLEDYISLRKGSTSRENKSFPSQEVDEDLARRTRQKERFRQMKTRKTEDSSGLLDSLSAWKSTRADGNSIQIEALTESLERAVHLFGLQEILNVFEDTCSGLEFLHSKGILHHDLKTENVLLHWESEDAMIPTALISDFGSSISQSENWSRERTGRTGTLDWVPPESLKKDPKTGKLYEVTQKGDLWQLGLLLHCLCFFRLPYAQSDNIDLLKDEIIKYPGFLMDENAEELKSFNMTMNSPDVQQFSRSDLPRSLIKLLSDLLCLDPRLRPSCNQVLRHLEKIRESDQNDASIFGMPKNSKRPHHGIHSLEAMLVSKRTRLSQKAGISRSISLNSGSLSLVQRRRRVSNMKDSETRSRDSNLKEENKRPLIVPGSRHGSQSPTDHNRHPATIEDDQLDASDNLADFEPVKSFRDSSSTSWSLVPFPGRQTNSLRRRRPLITQAFLARCIGVSICLKSMIFIMFIRPKNRYLPGASCPPNTTTPTARSRSIGLSMTDHYYDFMILIILNTWELLVGNPRFSIGLTVLESILMQLHRLLDVESC